MGAPLTPRYNVALRGTTGTWYGSEDTCLEWFAAGTSVDVRGDNAGRTLSGEWYMESFNSGTARWLNVRAVQSNDRVFEFDNAYPLVTPTTQNCATGATTFQILGWAQTFIQDGASWNLTPPVLVSPAAGHSAGREGVVVFSVRADNLRGAASYHAEVIVRNGSGAVVGRATTSEAWQGGNSTGTTLPLTPGNYTWTARTITTGYESGESAPRTLTVPANGIPSIPQLVSPSADQILAEAGPQVFTVRSTDPDGDPYTGVVTVRDRSTNAVVRTFDTIAAASGSEAVGHPLPALTAGLYSWTAHSEDASGAASPESAAGNFSVQATPTNSAPGAPMLVSPSSGSYSFGEPATFTVRADDPNLDPYAAHITVRHSDGTTYDIDTLYTASGANASGSPSTFLPGGTYTWWATAEDIHGSTGQQSATGNFTVSAATLFRRAI